MLYIVNIVSFKSCKCMCPYVIYVEINHQYRRTLVSHYRAKTRTSSSLRKIGKRAKHSMLKSISTKTCNSSSRRDESTTEAEIAAFTDKGEGSLGIDKIDFFLSFAFRHHIPKD